MNRPSTPRRSRAVIPVLIAAILAAGGVGTALIVHDGISARQTVTVTPHPDSPTATGTSRPAGSGSGGGAAVWRDVYSGKSLSIPAATGVCGSAGVDFDIPAGHLGGEAGDDLSVKVGCGSSDGVSKAHSAKAWGRSTAAQPTADTCRDDAFNQGMPGSVAHTSLTISSEYCLVTDKSAVVWFRITGKTGNDDQGQQLIASLWTRAS